MMQERDSIFVVVFVSMLSLCGCHPTFNAFLGGTHKHNPKTMNVVPLEEEVVNDFQSDEKRKDVPDAGGDGTGPRYFRFGSGFE